MINADQLTLGEILKEEFMQLHNLSPEELASRIHLTVTKVNKILKNEEPVDLNVASRLSKLFGNSCNFWLDIQSFNDCRRLAQDPDYQEIMKSIKPLNM